MDFGRYYFSPFDWPYGVVYMTALESLLTKLASDEFDRQTADDYFFEKKPSFCNNECSYSFIEGARWQHEKSHARMSLLVEMVKEMRSALQRIDRECDNDNSVAWPIAYETLQSIEAMAKEQT